ncbi:MAG: hypothetical protein AB7V46_00615 [Thermomicrobiales bacterium]
MIDPVQVISPRHFLAMSDDTGLFQHAVLNVPDRSHGYCVDDNARALLASYTLTGDGMAIGPQVLASRYAAFIQHAWNPDLRRFRNFMSFDRRWLEPQGSEDSHGRTLWALGICSKDDPSALRREWAARLFSQGYPSVSAFQSPRAWAFTILGLCAYCEARPDDMAALAMQDRLAGQLLALLQLQTNPHWIWFEDMLAYDNARLPQALMTAGLAGQQRDYIEAGLKSLNWLITVQVGEAGHFRPVGSDSFGARHTPPEPFDQQPLEVAAMIAACRVGYEATGDAPYLAEANRAYRWLLGANDLGIALLDVATGRCRDGLHPDRANANCGGESVVSVLLAAADMQALKRASRTILTVAL